MVSDRGRLFPGAVGADDKRRIYLRVLAREVVDLTISSVMTLGTENASCWSAAQLQSVFGRHRGPMP